MYEIILENGKLVKEKVKVAIEFTHPVLILPEKSSSSFQFYSNSEFESKMYSLQQQIENLEKVDGLDKVKRKDLKSNENKLNLLRYLSQQQKGFKMSNGNASSLQDFNTTFDSNIVLF
ncbi:unnamed protein product [Moneuplotes crassus]|uniref:Uncharacterized protein n=1 Tax=Euplotes crassus TaxID=5936 RepID=A0AAD1XHP2_EUPCR|nr:unnamed protein product [Moneuplotes crassus]